MYICYWNKSPFLTFWKLGKCWWATLKCVRDCLRNCRVTSAGGHLTGDFFPLFLLAQVPKDALSSWRYVPKWLFILHLIVSCLSGLRTRLSTIFKGCPRNLEQQIACDKYKRWHFLQTLWSHESGFQRDSDCCKIVKTMWNVLGLQAGVCGRRVIQRFYMLTAELVLSYHPAQPPTLVTDRGGGECSLSTLSIFTMLESFFLKS